MSLETDGGSAAVTETVTTEATPVVSAPVVSEQKGSYTATDPGYEINLDPEGEVDELAELIAENKKPKPSETLDDASETDGDTEEAAETPTDDESAVVSQEPSDELLDRALELGYTLAELKSFKDVQSLEAEVERVEKVHKRLLERQAANQPVTETIPPVEENPEPKWDELIEQGHDPDIVNLQKQTWQRAERAEAQARQLLQAEQARALEAQSERFDEALNKMEGFEKILGTGRRGDLAQASPEHAANRQEVFTKMLVLKAGYELAGKPVPPEAKLIREAVHASFYDHAQTTAREKLKRDIKDAGSQALSRPNSSGAKPLSGPSLALQKETEFWKSKGV